MKRNQDNGTRRVSSARPPEPRPSVHRRPHNSNIEAQHVLMLLLVLLLLVILGGTASMIFRQWPLPTPPAAEMAVSEAPPPPAPVPAPVPVPAAKPDPVSSRPTPPPPALPPVAEDAIDRALVESTIPPTYVQRVSSQTRGDARGKWQYRDYDVTLPPEMSWPKLRSRLVANLAGNRLSVTEERGAAPGTARIRVAQQSRIIAEALIHPLAPVAEKPAPVLKGSEPTLDEDVATAREGLDPVVKMAQANQDNGVPKGEPVPEPTPVPETKPVLEPVSQPLPEPVPEPLPESAPILNAATPPTVAEPALEPMPERVVNTATSPPAPEPVPEPTPLLAAEPGVNVAAPPPTPEPVPEPTPLLATEPVVNTATPPPALNPVTEPAPPPTPEPASTSPTTEPNIPEPPPPPASLPAPLLVPEPAQEPTAQSEPAPTPVPVPQPEVAPATSSPDPQNSPSSHGSPAQEPEPVAQPEPDPADKLLIASAKGGRPRVAIILDDGGYGGPDTEQALSLDTKVTLAILPNTPSARNTAQRAVAQGFEVMLHMPMETAVKGIRAVGGQLDTSMDRAAIRRLTLDALAQVPGAKGVNYHTGGKFIQDYERTAWFMEVVRDQKLYFVDSRTTGRSAGHAAAAALGVRNADRDVFLDNEGSSDYIRRQFELLVDGAQKRGTAVGIGHFRHNTVAVLRELLPKLSARGIELVHVSELLP